MNVRVQVGSKLLQTGKKVRFSLSACAIAVTAGCMLPNVTAAPQSDVPSTAIDGTVAADPNAETVVPPLQPSAAGSDGAMAFDAAGELPSAGAPSMAPAAGSAQGGAGEPEAALDPCTPDPCSPGGACHVGANGGPECECRPPFVGTGSARCVDGDDCAGNPCGSGGTCTDEIGTYKCTCLPGYRATGTNVCTNIDDCLGNPCGAGGSCADGIQTYSCTCRSGYMGTGTKSCVNIDECKDDPCSPGGTCVDGLSQFTCNCSIAGDGPESCPHKDNGDGTLDDAVTGLTWQTQTSTIPRDIGNTANNAEAICNRSTVAGGGWRLPNANELFGIFDTLDRSSVTCYQANDSFCCTYDLPQGQFPETLDVRCVR